MSKSRLLGAALLVAPLLSAPSGADIGPSPMSAPDGSVMAAWTQITGNDAGSGQLTGLIRFALAGTGGQAACDNYSLSVAPASVPPTLRARQNIVPSKFPVTVCESTANPTWTAIDLMASGHQATLWLPDGTAGPVISFPSLHAVGRNPNKMMQMVTVGDTGCRDNSQQSCSSADTWPFEALATEAAKLAPDFVLHVGDYRYSNKGHSDTWTYWYQEFFYPARNLLLTAPWVMARGNHEACGYDNPSVVDAPWGTGWFYFLQHNSVRNSLSCPTDSTEYVPDPTAYQPPWHLDTGVLSASGGLSAPSRLIVMDSSTDNPSPQQVANFTTMLKDTDAVTVAWWIGHRPIWGVNPYGPYSLEDDLVQDLTSALSSFTPSTPCWTDQNLPCSLRGVVAGHIHNLERVQFFGTGTNSRKWLRPMQYVSGNSGVVINPPMNTSPCALTIPTSTGPSYGTQLTGTVDWSNSFGFTLWTRGASTTDPSGWDETRYFYDGGTIRPTAPPSLDGTSASVTCAK